MTQQELKQQFVQNKSIIKTFVAFDLIHTAEYKEWNDKLYQQGIMLDFDDAALRFMKEVGIKLIADRIGE